MMFSSNSSSRPSPQLAGNMPCNLDLTLLEEVSRQMASSNLSRQHSKSSNSSRMGGSMRIAKASSTSNSPRNTASLNRRKAGMGGGSLRRQPLSADQSMQEDYGERSQAFLTPLQAASQARPMSWHPSVYPVEDTTYQPVYNSTITDYSMSFNNNQDLPNTPALLQSNYGSPSVAFSPEPQPWANYDQEYSLYDTASLMQPSVNSTMAHLGVYAPYQLPLSEETQQTSLNDYMNPSTYSHFDWNNFATNGFEDGTAPPTPENFLPVQHVDPPCDIETSAPYHSLDEQADEGEILIGMGLYDAPEKTSLPDVQLNQYRTAMITQYLGSAYRATEPTGKGLKLEETWKPSDEDDAEDGEDQDGDCDAEGSVADEDEQPSGQGVQVPAVKHVESVDPAAAIHPAVQLQGQSCHQGDGWR